MFSPPPLWLALMIGNSRWHWGAFEGDRWLGAWHTPRLSEAQARRLQQSAFAPNLWQQMGIATVLPPASISAEPPGLWLASVVESPLTWLADYPALYRVETAQVPLEGTYATLGVDRALALVGAGEVWNWPVLVVDCGTALTFTAGVDGRLLGGAILPGLRSQFRALHADTDRLPALDLTWEPWPQRWATETAGAIASGILHSQVAGIRDFIAAWVAEQPGGTVVMTGGDSAPIFAYLVRQTPALAHRVSLDPDLVFWGLRVCRRRALGRL